MILMIFTTNFISRAISLYNTTGERKVELINEIKQEKYKMQLEITNRILEIKQRKMEESIRQYKNMEQIDISDSFYRYIRAQARHGYRSIMINFGKSIEIYQNPKSRYQYVSISNKPFKHKKVDISRERLFWTIIPGKYRAVRKILSRLS